MDNRNTMTHEGHFLEIDADECRRLLKEAVVGRVCWSADGVITVLPVTFGVVDGSIVFRCSAGSMLARLATPTEVAFEVDDLDTPTATGWSVVARGTSRAWASADPGEVIGHPWAPGVRDRLIEIVPASFTGRAVSSSHI